MVSGLWELLEDHVSCGHAQQEEDTVLLRERERWRGGGGGWGEMKAGVYYGIDKDTCQCQV